MENIQESVNNKTNCCGCTACVNICAQQAIQMKQDEEGFSYPVVNGKLCKACGRCSLVCPVLNVSATQEHFHEKYAAKVSDEKVRAASTSGGTYTALSDYVLGQGGVVYGSVFDREWIVRYIRITDRKQRDASRGAKYVQSDPGGVFSQVAEDMRCGRTVLFVGPPCYVAGLRLYVECSVKNSSGMLITADMVCHGVPSPLIWKENISFLKKRYSGEWVNYSFRDKSQGWRGTHNTLITKDKNVSGKRELNAYTSLYFGGYISRPSCSHCPFASLKRVGDITIGDCWGIEECHPEFDDAKGISLIMVNTEVGKRLFDKTKKQFNLIRLKEDECVQPQLIRPAEDADDRAAFWKLYKKKGYEACIKKYTSFGIMNYLKHGIKKILSR